MTTNTGVEPAHFTSGSTPYTLDERAPTARVVPPAPTAPGGQLPAGVSIASPGLRLGSWLLEVLLIMVTLGIGWAIWATTTAGTGQTPAKRLLGLRVIGADTLRPASFGKMFWVRGLLGGIVASFALPFTLYILVFMPLWDKRSQNIWDKVSNCYVVSDRVDAWGCQADLR